MCQFHQVAIIRRYITKKPKIPPNKDLKILGELLTRTDRETFEYYLKRYEETYGDFLKEKTRYIDLSSGKEKWHYTHKKTRSAFFSLKRNLWVNRKNSVLFTHYFFYLPKLVLSLRLV